MVDFLKLHLRQVLAGWLLLTAAAVLTVCLCANTYWSGRSTVQPQLLIASNALSPQQFLPESYVARAATVPGVTAASGLSSAAVWLPVLERGAGALIVDKASIARVLPSLAASPGALARWQSGRDHVLLSTGLERRLGMASGASLSIRIFEGSTPLPVTLTIAGSFQRNEVLECELCMLIGRDFVEEALPSYRGVVSAILLRSPDPSRQAEVAARVDERFASESVATQTSQFSSDQGAQLSRVMDLRGMALSVAACVLVMVMAIPALIVYLSAMAYRDAFALLLTLGFQRRWLYRNLIVGVVAFCASAAAIAFGLMCTLDAAGITTDIAWLHIDSMSFGLVGAAAFTVLCAGLMLAALGAAFRNVQAGDLLEEATL